MAAFSFFTIGVLRTMFVPASYLLRSLFAPTLSKYAVNTAEKRRKGEGKPYKR